MDFFVNQGSSSVTEGGGDGVRGSCFPGLHGQDSGSWGIFLHLTVSDVWLFLLVSLHIALILVLFRIKLPGVPGGTVVEILGFHCHGPGSIPVGELRSCKQAWAKKKVQSQGHRGESTSWKSVTLRAGSWLCCFLAGIPWASSFMFLHFSFLTRKMITFPPLYLGLQGDQTCQS